MDHAVSLALDHPEVKGFWRQARALGAWLVGLRFFWLAVGIVAGAGFGAFL